MPCRAPADRVTGEPRSADTLRLKAVLMESIVLELQRKALTADCDVAELVRMTLVVASKLRLDDFRQWAELELNGYPDQPLPLYRVVKAEVKAHSLYQGWVPIVFKDSKMAEAACSARCRNSVGDLQYMLAHHTEGHCVHLPYSDEVKTMLMRGLDVEAVPTRVIGVVQVAGVLDKVRNTILDWALELEQSGILGEGMTFSPEEKEKASTASSIHIDTFQGVLGNVQAEQVQIGDYSSIHGRLKELGVPQFARNELENIWDEFREAKGKARESLAKRGLEWVTRHADTIGKLAGVIRAWFTAV